jgi:drug/metabolite transporter (DMT)-like permease
LARLGNATLADQQKHTDRTPLLPIIAAALVGVQVGVATVASRFVIGETDPIMLGAMRYSIGVVCLLPFLARAGLPRFAARDVLPMAVLGILQFAVLIVLFNIALQTSPAARVAVVFSAFPLLTMVFAAAIGLERLTVAKAGGVGLTILGVALAIGDKAFVEGGAFTGGARALWIGDVAAFGAALCGAACSVLYRPYLTRYPALAVSAFAMFVSAAFLLVVALVGGQFAAQARLSSAGLAAVIFVGLSSGLAFSLLLWTYARSSPTKVAIFQALAPIVATGLGWAILGEPVTQMFLAGLALVAAGIVLAHRPAARRPQ